MKNSSVIKFMRIYEAVLLLLQYVCVCVCIHTHTYRQRVFYFTTNYRLLVIQKAQWYAATETKTYAIYNMYIIYT